jgi:hypothetical protein
MSGENVEVILDQWDAWSEGNLDKWARVRANYGWTMSKALEAAGLSG